MATTIRAAGGTVVRYVATPPHYRSMEVGIAANTAVAFKGNTSAGASEINVYDSSPFYWTTGNPAPAPTGWYSEAVTAEVTISGDITVTIGAFVANALANVRLRAYVWKITGGGSDIWTLLGVGDGTTALTVTPTAHAITVTVPTPVTVAPKEQFIVRITGIPVSGQTMGGPYLVTLQSGQTGATLALKVDFTETITFLQDPNVYLFARRTSTIGIGGFMDLLTARGSSVSTTGVVATEASGTEIQWTDAASEAFGATDLSAAAVADTANATTYASGSFTPVANRLYLLAVTHSDAAPETTVPTITTTTGLNFVEVATIVFDTIASNLHRLTLFRAMEASGLSAGTYTVNLADAGTGCCTRLTEVTNVVTTGADGADAVINISTNNANAGANPSVTLAAFTDVDNGTYACFASDINTAPTAGSGFTGLGHSTIGTPTKGVFAEWKATNDTTADCTLASSDWAGIAVELVQQPPAGAPNVLEWISPRFAKPWRFPYENNYLAFTTQIETHAFESDAAANCSTRVKLFRYLPDGTEVLLFTDERSTELGTTVSTFLISSQNTEHQDNPQWCYTDERLILRVYIYNIGTMAGGHTCTIHYDNNNVGTGDLHVRIACPIEFKAEGDPAALHAIPGGMSTLGLGNDGA